MLLVGTSDHLEDLDRELSLAEDVRVTAIAGGRSALPGGAVHVLFDDRRICRVDGNGVVPVADLGEATGQSMAADGAVLVVGLAAARLAVVDAPSGGMTSLGAFEGVDGRDTWENPAGSTPDLRSMAVTSSGAWLVNVHVGGVWRSTDRGASWHSVVPPDADVHEVAAGDGGRVVAAAAGGVGWSLDDGVTWTWTADGLHAPYCRAAALDGRTIYVTASDGPSTSDGRLYRGELGSPLAPCDRGVPESFPFNLDSGSLDARDGQVALGAVDGRVFRSSDGGETFQEVPERVGGHVRVVRFA